MGQSRARPELAPESEEGYEAARSYLKERFAAWGRTNGAGLDDNAGEAIIHYKWGYLDGDLGCWRRSDLDEIYLRLHPAKVVVEPDELDEVIEEAKAFMAFLDAEGLLEEASDPAEVLIAHLDSIAGRFRRYMADPSRYSFGKRFFTSAITAGVDPGDKGAVDAFMEEFNSRPRADREAVLGPRPKTTTGRFTPPGTGPPRRKRRR